MNKKEFVGALAEQCGCTQVQAGQFLDTFSGTIVNELKHGNEVNLPGFGKFIAKHRPARQMRNPATGGMMMSKAKTSAQFRPASALKDL